MYIAYTEEQEALRHQLRAYYERLLTPEVREEVFRGHGIGAAMRSVVRQMGADGWLGIGWPKEVQRELIGMFGLGLPRMPRFWDNPELTEECGPLMVLLDPAGE